MFNDNRLQHSDQFELLALPRFPASPPLHRFRRWNMEVIGIGDVGHQAVTEILRTWSGDNAFADEGWSDDSEAHIRFYLGDFRDEGEQRLLNDVIRRECAAETAVHGTTDRLLPARLVISTCGQSLDHLDAVREHVHQCIVRSALTDADPLADAVYGIWSLVGQEGLVCVDYADLMTVLCRGRFAEIHIATLEDDLPCEPAWLACVANILGNEVTMADFEIAVCKVRRSLCSDEKPAVLGMNFDARRAYSRPRLVALFVRD